MHTSESHAIRTQKQALRLQMAQMREEMPGLAFDQATCGLRQVLLDFLHELARPAAAPDPACGDRPLPRIAVEAGRNLRLGVYAAIRNEADLSAAWPDLMAWPADLYFPAIQGKGQSSRLVFGKLPAGLDPQAFLILGCFGIDEPPESDWLPEAPELDAILVPGLAFDCFGSRVGWGKAYYDRLLPQLPGRPIRIGVCHSFQIVEGRLPSDSNDQRVDWLLTPEGCRPVCLTQDLP